MTQANTEIAQQSEVEISKLVEFKFGNSRSKVIEAKFNDIKNSIKEIGVTQPILVRPSVEHEGCFEVIAGNTRWKAAKELGHKSIPANIRFMSDEIAYEAHLAENLLRADISIVDEAKAAQQFLSVAEGDYKEAASRLGWNENKVRERINLLRCSDTVLDALNEEKIQIGHAVVLSGFTEKLQDGTLSKILEENWSVKYLKERAGKAQRYLRKAKFDQSDCANCQHNTIQQKDMFDTASDEAKCSKLSCWKEKTDAWLATQKAKAEEKYGKVLLFIECGDKDRNTLSSNILGEEQIQQGCSGCESNVAIIDDRADKEGNIIESQCVDKICFEKQKKAFQKANAAPKATNNNDSKQHQTPVQAKGDSATAIKPTKPVEQKTPKSVGLKEEQTLRLATFETIKDDPKLLPAFLLALVARHTGIKNKITEDCSSFNELVMQSFTADLDNINQAINSSILEFLSKKKDESTTEQNSPTRIMLSLLKTLDNKVDIAKKAWIADKATLENYTIKGIEMLCLKSGFIEVFDNDDANREKKVTFEKLAKKGKSSLIDGIVSFNKFDWQGFAPNTIMTMANKG